MAAEQKRGTPESTVLSELVQEVRLLRASHDRLASRLDAHLDGMEASPPPSIAREGPPEGATSGATSARGGEADPSALGAAEPPHSPTAVDDVVMDDDMMGMLRDLKLAQQNEARKKDRAKTVALPDADATGRRSRGLSSDLDRRARCIFSPETPAMNVWNIWVGRRQGLEPPW